MPELDPQTLLSERGVVTPDDAKHLRAFELLVPYGESEHWLELFFDYQPRVSEDEERNQRSVSAVLDEYVAGVEAEWPELTRRARARQDVVGCARSLRSLMNVTLYDPGGRFRGRWDQNLTRLSTAVRVARAGSSTGFEDGPIAPGRWLVVLEIHAVITDRCEYELVVRLLHDPRSAADEPGGSIAPAWGEETSVPAPALRRSSRSRAALSPAVSPRAGWLRGEMHTHTRRSDGKRTLEEIAELADASGLDFVAISDHNTAVGNERLLELNRRRADGPLFLPAEELTTFRGHFGLYGVLDTVRWYHEGQLAHIVDVADRVRAEGGLFSLAHPFQVGDPICTGCRWPGMDPPEDRLDLLEVWVGAWWERGVETVKGLALWDRLWDQGLRPVGIAARDWHDQRQDDGPERRFPRTMVRSDERSAQAVMAALRRGEVYLSVGPHVDLCVETTRGRAGIGGAIELDGAGVARVIVSDLREASTLRLLRDGRPVGAIDLDGGDDRAIEIDVDVDDPGRYRVELRERESGAPLLVTNHAVVGDGGG